MNATNGEDLAQSIREALVCPICEKTVTPPVVQCKNGHLICKFHKKSKCPSCRAKFSTVSPAVFNRILNPLQHMAVGRSLSANDAIATRKCNHPGCSQKVPIGDDHELWCGYRPTVCMFDDSFHNCKWTGIVSRLPKHVESKHSGMNICNDKAPSTIENVSLDELDIIKHTGWGFTNGSFFWLEVEHNAFKHSFTFKVTLVPIKKIEDDLNIWIEIKAKNSKFCSVTKLDLDPYSDYRDKNCVTVHTDFLKDVVAEDKKLWYKLDIVKDMEKSFENYII
ncbi:E3 ubiquitin-protein ligase SINA-like 3 [Homalodisca vitripennis]|uniref:E3 ubiquitin-protein ligase SINA-like 3 n=1 Tax=Homalodisca vitripennis TaxID=197043 RepID=UPI001EEB89F1|nr:E3 ubiquitin-protein ligase SINA-like 3 [Homalodisca vitripennis]